MLLKRYVFKEFLLNILFCRSAFFVLPLIELPARSLRQGGRQVPL